jgi:hypothetical protein
VTQTVADALAASLRSAAAYNQGDKAPPVAVLWPDPDRKWERIVQSLRENLPILNFGEYDEASHSGPGVWIRCVLGGELLDSPGGPWIVWLPGIARDDLRAVESAPAHLRSMAELQYRADWWTQRDRSAWTPASWLRSQDGLGIDLARDTATREALDLALGEVFTLGVEELRRRGRIDSDYLTSLVSRDEVRTLLRWVNDPPAVEAELSQAEWQAFRAQCRKEFAVDITKEGQLSVAERLANGGGAWDTAWQRFEEAPGQYPNLPDVLRRARSQLTFDVARWPQDNEEAESQLQAQLRKLGQSTPAEARDRVLQLEAEHGLRRRTVWARLGLSPLAHSLEHLARLAEQTGALPHHEAASGYVDWYVSEGHRADQAAVQALAQVRAADLEAVGVAVRALCYDWLDGTTRRYQEAIEPAGYEPSRGLELQDGDCVVFVDGLRYDVGKCLQAALAARSLEATIDHRLAPVPSVTSTGKAAVTPFGGDARAGDGFDLRLEGKALSVKEALGERGVTVLPPGESSLAGARGWTEAADIDKTGHNLRLAVAERLEGQVNDIAARVQDLLDNGWTRVRVVTDHGWLLMPGGLSKHELPESRTEVRKPRAARLKPGADDGGYPGVDYVYDPSVRIVSPHGIAAFEAGTVYDHGGISLQECVTPVLTVTKGDGGSASARIIDVSWVNLRCRVVVEAAPAGAAVDVRVNAGDAGSSVTTRSKAVEGSDEGAVLVGDDTLEGRDVYAVLVSADGAILSQKSTRVGG